MDANQPRGETPLSSSGQRLGGFELLARLGQGGMGAVFKARQVSMDRLVALKILPKRLAQNEQFVARFLREARSAARLRHPNIVQAYDAGCLGGVYYFAMEYVDGETLEALLRREGPLPPSRALTILKQTCSALAAAHDGGIIHRDIKPSNIMLDSGGQVRVTDFGLAKRVEGDLTVTADGQTLGTPAYVSPEMAAGKPVDTRADLYSLGATFFHVLAGRPPFVGSNFSEVIVKHVNEAAPALRELAPQADPCLCEIIDRLLRKGPAERYPSAQALLADLESIGPLESPQDTAPAVGRAMLAEAPTVTLTEGRRLERKIAIEASQGARHRRLPVALAVAGGLALVACLVLLLGPGRKRLQATPTPKPTTGAILKPTTGTLPMPPPKPKPSTPTPPPPPPLPEPPPGTLEAILKAWPLAFEDGLAQPVCLQRALLAKGQYGGRFDVRGALIVSGIHTASAAWWNCPVGQRSALSVDLRIVGGAPCIWLGGPGYGNSTSLGYALLPTLEGNSLKLELQRDGVALGVPLRRTPLQQGEWCHLDVVRDKEKFTVHVEGDKLGEWCDRAPLVGPTHAFLALGGIHGLSGDNGSWYRDLAIRVPKEEAGRLAAQPIERVFDPPPSTPPTPNGKAIAADEFADDGLSQWSAVWAAEHVRKQAEGVVLCGPNAWPFLWRKEPFRGDFAVEAHFSYLSGGEALNFHALLRIGEIIGGKQEAFHGWAVVFPKGDGLTRLEWHDEQGKTRVLASTPYFVPVSGRPYVLRLEKRGQGLRVFSNGGFLLEAKAPGPLLADASFRAGILQGFAGSLVRRVVAWQLP